MPLLLLLLLDSCQTSLKRCPASPLSPAARYRLVSGLRQGGICISKDPGGLIRLLRCHFECKQVQENPAVCQHWQLWQQCSLLSVLTPARSCGHSLPAERVLRRSDDCFSAATYSLQPSLGTLGTVKPVDLEHTAVATKAAWPAAAVRSLDHLKSRSHSDGLPLLHRRPML